MIRLIVYLGWSTEATGIPHNEISQVCALLKHAADQKDKKARRPQRRCEKHRQAARYESSGKILSQSVKAQVRRTACPEAQGRRSQQRFGQSHQPGERRTTVHRKLQARRPGGAAAGCRRPASFRRPEAAQNLPLRFQPRPGAELGRKRQPRHGRMPNRPDRPRRHRRRNQGFRAATGMARRPLQDRKPESGCRPAENAFQALPRLGRQSRAPPDHRAAGCGCPKSQGFEW